ncbi:MAG: hypothetical protein AAF409_08665 [Pseudomonadota bacterium]
MIDFNFSFTNSSVAGGGSVTGIVRGLRDNMSGQAATSVEILTNTAGFGVGEYVGSPNRNSWDVAGGVITQASFRSFGGSNTAPSVTDSSFAITESSVLPGIVQVGVRNAPDFSFATSTGQSPQQFFTPTVIPLPATLPLLLGALWLIGLAARRKKIAPAAIAS